MIKDTLRPRTDLEKQIYELAIYLIPELKSVQVEEETDTVLFCFAVKELVQAVKIEKRHFPTIAFLHSNLTLVRRELLRAIAKNVKR